MLHLSSYTILTNVHAAHSILAAELKKVSISIKKTKNEKKIMEQSVKLSIDAPN